jgi:hypothetical protein
VATTAQAHRVFVLSRSRDLDHPNRGRRGQCRNRLHAALVRKIVSSHPVRASNVRSHGVRSARSSHAGNSAPRASDLHGQNAHAAALIAEDRPGRGPSTKREAPRVLPGASKGHRGRRRNLLHAALARQIVSSSPARASNVRSRGIRSARSSHGRNSAPRANALHGQSTHAAALIAEAQGPSTKREAPRALPGAKVSLLPLIADHLELRVAIPGIRAAAGRAGREGFKFQSFKVSRDAGGARCQRRATPAEFDRVCGAFHFTPARCNGRHAAP